MLFIVSFDLEEKDSKKRETAYGILKSLRLHKDIIAPGGAWVVLPNTTVIGAADYSTAEALKAEIEERFLRSSLIITHLVVAIIAQLPNDVECYAARGPEVE